VLEIPHLEVHHKETMGPIAITLLLLIMVLLVAVEQMLLVTVAQIPQVAMVAQENLMQLPA
jgi:hypothetical protein